VVRDAALTDDSVLRLKEIRTDLPFTEVKWEAAIDRVTSAATPRQQERVPAGTVFRGALTFSMYDDLARDAHLFSTIVRGLRLVEEDYLGGQGARGSGQVRFTNIALKVRATPLFKDTTLIQESLADLDALNSAWTTVLANLTA
jgi:CRISPR-associated protein Csm3